MEAWAGRLTPRSLPRSCTQVAGQLELLAEVPGEEAVEEVAQLDADPSAERDPGARPQGRQGLDRAGGQALGLPAGLAVLLAQRAAGGVETEGGLVQEVRQHGPGHDPEIGMERFEVPRPQRQVGDQQQAQADPEQRQRAQVDSEDVPQARTPVVSKN